MNPRAIAAYIIQQVHQQRRTLTSAIDKQLADHPQPQQHALIKEYSYGVCRHFFQLQEIADHLLTKPLKRKDADIYYLILIGLYQLIFMRKQTHACVNETVNAAGDLKKSWAKKLINAILRGYLRDQITAEEANHPPWLLHEIKNAWPQDWQTIIKQNNQRPPFMIRIDTQHTSPDDYLQLCQANNIKAKLAYPNSCIEIIDPIPVTALPGWETGLVAVQDGAAQLAATLLNANAGERILDACAAPGGKTLHILQQSPDIEELVAIDISEKRCDLITENLKRCAQSATVICHDIKQIDQWWDGCLFDRILLDAPCSATGVIRRHPDIKLLRQAADINVLSIQQQQLLTTLWDLLKPGGQLLYVTCSILPAENQSVIANFLQSHSAQLTELPPLPGISLNIGQQILPSQENMDGFYYCCLYKKI